MKLFLTLFVIIAGVACDPVDAVDTARDQGVRRYANACTNKLWNNVNLAEKYGLENKTHREIYEACARDAQVKRYR